MAMGIYSLVKPKIQQWLIGQVDRLSKEQLPIDLKIESLNWSLFFPGIELNGISISPKAGDKTELRNLPPIKIEKISASLDFLQAFTGRLGISTLILDEVSVSVDLDPFLESQGPAQSLPTKVLFNWLKKIPISQLGFKSAHINLQSKKLKTAFALKNFDGLLMNRQDRLVVQIDINDSNVQFTGENTEPIPFRLQLEAIVYPKNLDVSSLKIGILNSLISVNGNFSNLPELPIHPEAQLDYEISSDFSQLSLALKTLMKFPNMSGTAKASGKVSINGLKDIEGGFKLFSQKVIVDQFTIGDIQTSGTYKDSQLELPTFSVTNDAGMVDATDVVSNITVGENGLKADVRGNVKTSQIDINELLIRLGVGDIPVEGFASGQLKCLGNVWPTTEVNCQGDVKAEQIEVRTGEKYDDILLSVDELSATGTATVTQHQVSYRADLIAPLSKGTSDGVITYMNGYKINYSSPDFQFKDVRRLAGLKIEGHTEVSGSTEGNTKAATFGLEMNAKDVFFENFKLGDASTRLSYQKGYLKFADMKGSLGTTKYNVDLTVDLNRKRLNAKGNLPFFDIPEFLTVFERQFTLPIQILGTGNASLEVEGPFALGKLSYNLVTNLNQGSAGGETFDQGQFHFISESGEMKIQNAVLKKTGSDVRMTGLSHPDGTVQLEIEGNRLPLENSENVTKIGSQISGLLDIKMQLTGYVLSPDTKATGRISSLAIEEQEFPASVFDVAITKQNMIGTVDLFGKQLRSKFQFPFTDNGPFQLSLKSKDWNYTTLASLIGAGSLLNDYTAALTGDLELQSDQGGLWSSTGSGTIQKLLLQRGTMQLKNTEPMELKMSNGSISLNRFHLEGDKTFVDIQGKGFSKNELRVKILGQANLRLFQIFLPFLEELAGQAQAEMDISGPLLKPNILGTANIRNGFVKIKGFPHPFEKMSSGIQFSQSRILVETLSGNIAGGTFKGDGSVLIQGPRDFPTSIKARLSDVNFNVPENMRTSGNAEVTLTGNWFPFTLSGTYRVQETLVTKEFTDDGDGSSSLKQSTYLPKMILQNAFEPLLLDLNVILEKPAVVKNSLMDGKVSGSIQVRGVPSRPVLTGRLNSEVGTKLITRDKVFDVQSANIQFTGSEEINPDIYVSARTRITEYDISLLAQGTAKNPQIRMTSVPPLAEQDISSLIAFGVTTQALDRQNEARSRAAKDTASFGATAAAVLLQQKEVKKFTNATGLDVQVSSSYDDTKSVSVQRYTVSRKISDKVRASATQVTGSKSAVEYTLQYRFTNNVSAIARYEDRKASDNTQAYDGSSNQSQSILGLDLEYMKEFK
jgi:translocation and assembly module TamB